MNLSYTIEISNVEMVLRVEMIENWFIWLTQVYPNWSDH
jgi:hypothetical protein